jgi:preprotein translocase subunit SecY
LWTSRHRSWLVHPRFDSDDLVDGTMFVMWLGEQITARGIGKGPSLIIVSGIVAALIERAVA